MCPGQHPRNACTPVNHPFSEEGFKLAGSLHSFSKNKNKKMQRIHMMYNFGLTVKLTCSACNISCKVEILLEPWFELHWILDLWPGVFSKTIELLCSFGRWGFNLACVLPPPLLFIRLLSMKWLKPWNNWNNNNNPEMQV